MRTYPKDPRCWLAELSDLERDPLPDLVRENLEPIRTIVEWAQGYLAQPHPELGRPGPVCPFVRPAMAKNTLFLTVIRGAELDTGDVLDVLSSYRQCFLDTEPVAGKDAALKSINIIFPDIPPSSVRRLIDDTQEMLKPSYVRDGIMIGEFHSGPPEKAGLWNEDFRPLNSPLPLLSIRHMVPTDFAFLKGRKEFMEAYLASYGERLPSALAPDVRQAAARFGLQEDGTPAAVEGCPLHLVRHAPAGEPAGTAAGADDAPACPLGQGP